MQLEAVAALFDALPSNATLADYRHAVIDDNILGLQSASGRRDAWKPLRSLYRFELKDPLFAALRQLWDEATDAARPRVLLLFVLAQDPILRATASAVLDKPVGAEVPRTDITDAVEHAWPSRFPPAALRKIGQYSSQTWQQAGYLDSNSVRIAQPPVDGYTAALALLLGHLSGSSGAQLMNSPWFTVLGASAHDAQVAARDAQSRGLIEFRSMGGVSEFGFSALLEPANPQQERLNL